MDSFSMDVDLPFSNKSSTLKRSNSAPMINVLNIVTREETLVQPLFESQNRTRRFSASSFSVGGLSPSSSPSSPCVVRTPSRISQIKHEEGMDIVNREVAHERKIQSALQISQSWEDLTLTESHDSDGMKRPRCFTEPLHISPSVYPLSSSPSPTRLGKQCFSPSMQQPVRNTTFSTSPVPSPTRKSVTRRSHSPIALRPSQLPMKRKFDCGEKMDCYPSPQKRFQTGIFAPDRVTHSLSSSSLDDSSSPDQAVPISAANTPESMSSSGSPCSIFKPVDPDSAMQDSEPPTLTGLESLPQESIPKSQSSTAAASIRGSKPSGHGGLVVSEVHLMSISTPNVNPDGKAEEKEPAEKPQPRTYLELTSSAHRSFPEPVKSAFSCPVRPAFSLGRQMAPALIVTSSTSATPSPVPPVFVSSPQPVITKAVVRPVLSESLQTQAVSAPVRRTSPLPISVPTMSAPMASIIRGPTQVQTTTSAHQAHPAVPATYSSHVPRGAAAVACITTLNKSAVATPITRAPHIYAPSIMSSQSSFQNRPTAGFHINATTRAPSLAHFRTTANAIPKTAPTTTSVVSRLTPSTTNLLPASHLLISSSRPADTMARSTLIHSTATLPKSHSHIHQVPQIMAPEKGFYRPAGVPTTVLSIQPAPVTTTVTSKPLISHHIQAIHTPVHLAPHPTITTHPSSIGSHSLPTTSIGSATTSLSQSSLQHHTHHPKVIAQAIHTGTSIPLLTPSNIMSPAPTRPVTITTAIALTTQSVPRPVASTGNTSTASIPVAKVYPQPLAVVTRPLPETSQHQDAARSGQTATLCVTASQRLPVAATTAGGTSISLGTSVTLSSATSNASLTERPSVPTPATYPFPSTMTCYYEPVQSVPSTLAMHSIPGPAAPRSYTALPVPTLRALPVHQPTNVTIHSAAVLPTVVSTTVNLSHMVMTMSPARHTLTVPNTYSKASEGTPAPSTNVPIAAAPHPHATTQPYSGGSPLQSGNSPANPPSSPRPSILRKRTVDGATVAIRKNLLSSMPSSQPVSPRPDPGGSGTGTILHAILPSKQTNNLREVPHENGQSSESTDSSCNGTLPLNIVIKQEPMDTLESSGSTRCAYPSSNRLSSVPMEASPRKKPRKQQLTGNELVETHSTDPEDEFEKESREMVKKESMKEEMMAVDGDGGGWIPKRKRPPVTLLHSYRQTWKSRHNHFMRYTDVRPRDERRPTAVELANQKSVIQKANGWKVYHICSQIDDLVELEGTVHSRLASLLEVMEKKTGTREDEDLDLNRANELMRGNIQRCKLIRDQMNDARHQVLKVLDHKTRVVEIVGKFTSKSSSKRK